MTIIETEQLDDAEQRKARGAFFTPNRVAEYMTRWAVRAESDRVLEPSCGEAAFLVAASNRLSSLALSGAGQQVKRSQLRGVELHSASAARARELVAMTGNAADIQVDDFFAVDPTPEFDAVIGNPPFVRYQGFSGDSRRGAQAAALRAGVRLNALASSWAAFTVHSALFLRPGGRMALVLPAELLTVNYAAEVRQFLMESFREVKLVMFSERVFPGVLEEVVLLLADGFRTGSASHASIYQVQKPDDLDVAVSAHRWTPSPTHGKWTLSLLRGQELSAYVSTASREELVPLSDWGTIRLGMVTGNNDFFALSPQRAHELGLRDDELLTLSPPGSRHLRELEFSESGRDELGRAGSSTLLFRPNEALSPAAARYVEAGHIAGVDLAYKCKVRTPWWRVPLLPPADLLLTYMNSDTPRLATNTAKAHHLNSVHGVYLEPTHARLAQALPIAALNSLTLLSAEIVGRSYGGGMLKLEPGEAGGWLMPAPSIVDRAQVELLSARAPILSTLRSGNLLGASRLVDAILLRSGFELSQETLELLRSARDTLLSRRLARGSEPSQS